ncbi:MAG: 4-hydroxy-tetrahydrodipicolinate reductase, partial [Gammaproteobacteria bacterium]
MAIKVGIAGVTGRMGAAVLFALRDTTGLTASIALVRPGGEKPDGIALAETLDAFLAGCDVVVDFSRPALLAELAPACAAAGKPLVSGTTGLEDATFKALTDAASRVAILHAPNMSIGINILRYLVEKASETL